MLFGHCLKETGLRGDANQAYAEAMRLAPRNIDILEARAHFLKTIGRLVEARTIFAAAVDLGAGAQTQAEAGLGGLPGRHPAADARPNGAIVWIDISDLLIFLQHSRHLSGIQRVLVALLDYVASEQDEACCVMTQPWDPRIWCFSRAALLDFHAVFIKHGGACKAMQAAIRRLRETACEAKPMESATLFLAGTFWVGGGNPLLLRSARSAGMTVVPLIYDLIPLRQPQFCAPASVEEFAVVLGETLREVDGVLAISAHTAGDIRQLMTDHGMPQVPVTPVLLAHRMNETAAVARWTDQISHLRRAPFILTVGTIERRKNHQLLLDVWLALAAEGPNPPKLVIIGRHGWDGDAFDAEMRRTRQVNGLVEVFPDVSDAELNALYGACLFTAFPSMAEGWGLPVGESLARGKLCVASNRDSIPEVGGDAALYVDPVDARAAVPVFRRLIFEPGALAAAEAHIRAAFRPRGWPEVVRDMMAALRRIRAAPSPAARQGPTLPPGTIYHPAPHLRDRSRNPLDTPLRMMLAEGWQRPGQKGTEMAGGRATLDLTLTTPGTLRLRLQADDTAIVESGGTQLRLDTAASGVLELSVTAGPLSLELHVLEREQGSAAGVWLTEVSFDAG